MGIKMGSALDRTGNEWHADTYQKGVGAEPLKCLCGVAVTHNPSHTRELHDKSVFTHTKFCLKIVQAWIRSAGSSRWDLRVARACK